MLSAPKFRAERALLTYCVDAVAPICLYFFSNYYSSDRVPWHQDAGYLLGDAVKTTVLGVWMPLCDVTPALDNGCLQCMPSNSRNSHHVPLMNVILLILGSVKQGARGLFVNDPHLVVLKFLLHIVKRADPHANVDLPCLATPPLVL